MIAISFGYNYTRRKLLKKTNSSVMKDYLEKPFPGKKSLISDLDIVSLDFETTGLNFQSDNVVSMGWVKIGHLGINLKSSFHQLISASGELPETSVVIHKITDNQLLDGVNIETALPIMLEHLSGKVMLAHSAKVELGFINKMCRELYDTDFVIPVIDTQYLAVRSFERQNITINNNELRLFNLRRANNMPAYRAHNALMDAIATAELFLVMAGKISPGRNASLGEFLS